MERYFVLGIILVNFMPTINSESSLVFKLKDAPELYKDFIKRYHRTFESEFDYNKRYVNFVQTLRYINSINAQTFTQQKVLPNQYADYSDDERRAFLRKTQKKIDPELKIILRMRDEPKHHRNMLRSGASKMKPTGYGIRSYA